MTAFIKIREKKKQLDWGISSPKFSYKTWSWQCIRYSSSSKPSFELLLLRPLLVFMMFFKFFVVTLALLVPSLCHRFGHHHSKTSKFQMQYEIDAGIGHFGINLHKTAVKHYYNNGENILLSPIGTYFSLAMTHLGASGNTRDELKNVMGLPSDDETVLRSHQFLGELYRRLQHSTYANVSVYNGLFLQNGNQVKDTFMDQIRKFYDTGVVNVDFSQTSAKDTINGWFNEKTHGKIPHFYDHDIPSDTKLILANALSFGSSWDRVFPHEYTKTDYFQIEDGQQEQVTMIHKTDSVPYYEDQAGKYQVIGIPYKNSEYFFYIVLPHESSCLKDVMENFSYDDIQKILHYSKPQTVDIKLPQLHFSVNEDMKAVLQDMGVHSLFLSPDLSNMFDQIRLKVSQMWHHVEFDLDEQGTDISSGTTQEYKIYDEFVPNQDAKPFYVQRPYTFFIYHPYTKSVMFYGSIFKTGSY